MRFLGRIVLFVVSAVAALTLCLAALAPYLPPSVSVFPAILALAFEWLWLGNVACAVLWLLTKWRRYITISLFALFVSIPALQNTVSLRRAKVPTTAQHTLRVMSYNTLRMGRLSSHKQTELMEYIKREDADVVFFQEFAASKKNKSYFMNLETIKDVLGYPYSYIDYKKYQGQNGFGTAVFSRYPLLNKQTIRYESETNQSDRCDMVVGGDTIRLINNHLESYRIMPTDLQVTGKGKEQLQESGEHIFKQMRKAYPHRQVQARIIRQEVEQSPYPVIVCGDFNDVPVSYTYRKIRGGLKDAFLESQKFAFGHTYCKREFGIRIDYILCSEQFAASAFRVDTTVDFSDHFPVSCRLSW